MKLRTLLFTFLLALPLTAADLIPLLPEKTTFLVSTSDVKALQKLDEHAVVKAMAAPALKKAFAPMLSKVSETLADAEKSWKTETGQSFEELRALFPGGAALALRMDAKFFGQRDEERSFSDDDFEGVMLAEFSGDEAVAEKVMNGFMTAADKLSESLKFPDDYAGSVDEYSGVKLHVWKLRKPRPDASDNAWALVDKVLIFTSGERALKACVDRAKKGGPSLAEMARFRNVAAKVKESEVAVFVDLGALLRDSLKSLLDAPGEAAGFNPKKLLTSLGVMDLDAAYFTANFKDAGMQAELGITYAQRPALLKIIAMDGPGMVPGFLPTNASQAAYGTLHVDRILPAVEDLLKEAFPEGGEMLTAQLDEMKKKTGVDLKKDLLSNLGPDLWSVSGDLIVPPGGFKPGASEQPQQPQVYGFRLKDRKAFELALGSLINWAAPGSALFEDREYQGHVIHLFKAAPFPVGYLATDDWLIITAGSMELLEQTLTRIKRGETGGIFAEPHIQAALRAFPPDDDGTSYTDFGGLLDMFATLFRQLPGDPLGAVIDVKALPDKLDIPLILLSRQYVDDTAFRVVLHLLEKAK